MLVGGAGCFLLLLLGSAAGAAAAPPAAPAAAAAAAAAPADYDATIEAVHARAAQATAARLLYAYNASIVAVGSNCTSSNSSWNKHGGIQGSTYSQAMVALYNNDNATRVEQARTFFEQLAECLAGPPGTTSTQQPLEMSYVTRSFALFNSRSARVASKQVASLGPSAESAMQAFFFKYLTQFGPLEKRWGNTTEAAIWSQFGSENRDVNEQTSCYIAAQYLALDPGYAARKPCKRQPATH